METPKRGSTVGSGEIVWDCMDCSESTIDEYYSLRDEVWHDATLAGEDHRRASLLLDKIDNGRFVTQRTVREYCELTRGFLCVGCVEARLGRRLGPEDFSSAPINDPSLAGTERLRARLLGVD